MTKTEIFLLILVILCWLSMMVNLIIRLLDTWEEEKHKKKQKEDLELKDTIIKELQEDNRELRKGMNKEALNYFLEKIQNINKSQKGDIWQPKIGEKYWITDNYGTICDFDYENDDTDQRFMSYGKCYPTKEKAEFENNREKYTRLFRQYVEQHSEPLDWENDSQRKCYCAYTYFDKNFVIATTSIWKDPFQIYASSEEVLQEAINFIGEDNFKKYILEVEE